MIDFLGIGAQKSGTSWLHQMLSLHPQVSFPAGKEVHFWDKGGKDSGRYAALFAHNDGRKHGDITPAYAILPLETIAQIHHHFPRLRLIFCLRHAAERAWSAALMALKRAEMEYEEASDQWFIDHFRSRGSRRRGDYETCLGHWLRYFPPQQLLLIHFGSIAARPREVLEAAARHIGVDPEIFQRMDDNAFRRKVFAGPGHKLRPALAPVLAELYDEAQARLEKTLLQLTCPVV